MRTRTLVVYFSCSANTQKVAGQIASLTGGDLCELQPVDAYPAAYEAVVERGLREKSGTLPALQLLKVDLNDYDTIILGSPNWFGTIAAPVMAFLQDNDLAGKRIFPFCTHGGGGAKNVQKDVERMAPGAAVSPVLACYGNGGADLGDTLAQWEKLKTATPQP